MINLQLINIQLFFFVSFGELILCVFIGFTISLTQCRKDVDNITPPEVITPLLVSGSVYGIISDEYGAPAQGVKVSHNTSTVQTDVNGVFILKDQFLNKAGAQIRIEKSGYYQSNKFTK